MMDITTRKGEVQKDLDLICRRGDLRCVKLNGKETTL